MYGMRECEKQSAFTCTYCRRYRHTVAVLMLRMQRRPAGRVVQLFTGCLMRPSDATRIIHSVWWQQYGSNNVRCCRIAVRELNSTLSRSSDEHNAFRFDRPEHEDKERRRAQGIDRGYMTCCLPWNWESSTKCCKTLSRQSKCPNGWRPVWHRAETESCSTTVWWWRISAIRFRIVQFPWSTILGENITYFET